MLSVVNAGRQKMALYDAECCYAECRDAECHGAIKTSFLHRSIFH
jgi:hypothetical protein